MVRDQESRKVRRLDVYLGNDDYLTLPGKQERATVPHKRMNIW